MKSRVQLRYGCDGHDDGDGGELYHVGENGFGDHDHGDGDHGDDGDQDDDGGVQNDGDDDDQDGSDVCDLCDVHNACLYQVHIFLVVLEHLLLPGLALPLLPLFHCVHHYLSIPPPGHLPFLGCKCHVCGDDGGDHHHAVGCRFHRTHYILPFFQM